nr:cation-translocating P-type ATPase [Streptomyces sp. SM13]
MAGRLAVVPALGLTTEDAGRRADAWGANEPAEPVRRPQWLRLLDQFGSWLIGILLATAVIAGTVGEVKNALVITVVLLVDATVRYLRERRAERSLEALPAGLPAPLSAIRLLWVNIVMDGPPAMALAFDPPQDNVMQRPPRPPGERVLEARLWPPSRAPAPS